MVSYRGALGPLPRSDFLVASLLALSDPYTEDDIQLHKHPNT
jgi:hypothetical protein